MMKQRMAKAGVLLFICMIFFTIISRAAYNLSIAGVTTEKPEPRTFSPEVSARGTVEGSREVAVAAEGNLRVGAVYVVPGQAVEAGEILFEVDLQDLAEKMQEKQMELQSLDLQIQSAAESAALEEESRNLNRMQVQEDYNRTAARENEAVDQALEELQKAREEYQNFMDGPGTGNGQAETDRQADSGDMTFGQAEAVPSGDGLSDAALSAGGEPDSVRIGQAEAVPSGDGLSDTALSADGEPDSVRTGQSLYAAVEEKQAAYDQALKAREESLYQAKKSVDQANLGTPRDYSVEQSRIVRGQKEAELAKLQVLWDAHGKITAPVKGMVTETAVRTGGTTTGGGDILLSSALEGTSLSVTFPEELRAYVREGQQAIVTGGAAGNDPFFGQPVSERVTIRTVADHYAGNGASGMGTREAMENASASENLSAGISGGRSGSMAAGISGNRSGSMAAGISGSRSGSMAAGISGNRSGSMAAGISGGTSGGGFTVTVDLPADRFAVGEVVKLEVEAQASHYDTCVPVGALHLSGEKRYYVNVAEKRSTILGEEWAVRRVDVELREKDGKYAAVEGISSEQEVVTESSRILEDGSRVKKINETD